MLIKITAWLKDHWEIIDECRLVNNIKEAANIVERLRHELHTEVVFKQI